MMKIDELLNRLQEQQPDVSNPDELTGRIMASLPDLPTEQPKPARRIRLYIASAIAAAASVLLLLTLHYSEEPTSEYVAADSREGVPAPEKALADSREGIPTPGKAPADLRERVPAPRKAPADLRERVPAPRKAPADSREGVPAPGKALADSREGVPPPGKALADLREGVPTSVEAVQTEHAQQTNRAQPAEPATEVLTERDIPITRPENYKYTPEEIALLKRQAAEAYLKWVELELEIAKHSQEQTAQQY
ncbi:MAG: hypothetical protein J6Y33_05305 [Prevotella sp.]|nr:hypothetical protein [Prevotella sp.]